MSYIFKSLFTLFLIVPLSVGAQGNAEHFLDQLTVISEVEDPKQVMQKLNQLALQLQEQNDSVKGVYYYHLGVSYGMQFSLDSANKFFKLSIDNASNAADTVTMMGSYNGLGNVARMSNQNEVAKNHFESGLDLAQESQQEAFQKWRSDLMGSLAGIFFDLKDFKTSLAYTREALAHAEEQNDSTKMALNLIRMAYVYNALEKAEEAYQVNVRAVEILEQIDNRPMLIYQYFSLGNELINRNQLSEARNYFLSCLKLSIEFDERETIAGSNNALGKIAMKQGDYKLAEEYAKMGLNMALKIEQFPHQRTSYQLLHDLAKKRKDYQGAVTYLEKYHAINDSLQKQETIESIEEFKVKYESAEKAKEIDSLNYQNQLAQADVSKERTLRFALIILIVIIILFSTIVYLIQRKQNNLKQRALSAEISEMRFQIKELLGKYEGQIDIDLETLNEQLVNPLSQREFDVLQQVFMQKSNKEIADDLFVSINTVKTHLKNIYPKLGVTNRSEALKSLMLTQQER